MRLKNSLLITILMVGSLSVKAQENSLASAFNNAQQKTLHEQLFVHTDKPSYLTGELLWFKVYCLNALDNKPLDISKVAYVELLDKNQVPVIQAKIALDKGTGNGSVYVPSTLVTGNYKLRAYTNWMKNFGPESFFEKPVAIINPLLSPEENKAVATANYDIQFFPEGGNLVAGAENRVGFRMVDKWGRGVALRGAVLDQRNDTVARFSPLRFGLGSFTFLPSAGNIYRAVIKTPGKDTFIPFVIGNAKTYGIRVNTTGDKLDVKVNCNGNPGTLYLLIYGAGMVNSAQRADPGGNSVNFVVDKTKLATGINHITVFNTANQPVAERLYFVRPEKKLSLNITSLQQSYSTRKKVELDFNTALTNSTVKAMLSMAVYKTDSLQRAADVDMQSYLWLQAGLKGNIESPGYYFAKAGAETDAALDNLMLTQGWSKFDWNEITANSKPVIKFLPEYNGHLISARLTDAGGLPKKGGIVYLTIPSKRVQMYPAESDSTGRLLFNTKQFYGPGEIIAQLNADIDTTSRIDILSPFADRYSKSAYPALNLTPGAGNALREYSLGMQVQNIYSANGMRTFYNPVVDSTAFYFKPAKTYKLDDFTRFTTIEEVLREYVPEVNVYKTKNRFHLRTLGENAAVGDDPLILVDGAPVFNANNLMAIDPLKIEKLDVVRTRYFYGPTVSEGIFSFTSYKGNMAGLELNPHAVVIDYEGLQLQRKFYSPVYDTPDQASSRLPDMRNVLYWLPVADTGINGKNTATFYTSDIPGIYTCVIQGITATGEAGYVTTTFEVK